LRLDIFYVIDRRRNRVFAKSSDLFRHLIGRKPGVLPDDRYDRDVDLGKNVRRRRLDRRDAEQQDEQRHHDERVWAPQG
jgi:hypothetical protein